MSVNLRENAFSVFPAVWANMHCEQWYYRLLFSKTVLRNPWEKVFHSKTTQPSWCHEMHAKSLQTAEYCRTYLYPSERESKWRELQQQDRGSRWQCSSDSAVWALGLSWAACLLLLETYTDQSPLHQHSPTVGPGEIPSSVHSSAILSSSSVHNWELKIEVDNLRELFWVYF